MAGLYVRLALEAPERRRDAVLERLLAVASEPSPIGDWRDDAQRQLLEPGSARVAAASILGHGVAEGTIPGHGHLLLVTPLHAEATMNSVRLPSGGVLHTDAAEAQCLAADHAAKLEGPGRPRLIAGTRGELMLWSEADFQVETRDPVALLGHDLRDAGPRGSGASRLLAWTSEVQMWLFDHPLNQARLAAGQRLITQLWPWGGGAVLQRLPEVPFEVTGEDEVFGLWQRLAATRTGDSRLIVVGTDVAEFPRGTGMVKAALRPALRNHGSVHLSAGRFRYSLRRLPRRWLARRERAWWEYFEHDA